MKWLKDQPRAGFEIFGRLDELPKTDIRRLIALGPNWYVRAVCSNIHDILTRILRIRRLLETRFVVVIAKCYRYRTVSNSIHSIP